MGYPNEDMRDYQRASRRRAERWHDGDVRNWALSQWSNALAGEVGELCGAVKEFDRKLAGAKGKDWSWGQIQVAIAEEVADVIAYALLIAEWADVDALRAFEGKFNAVSIERDFPERVGSGYKRAADGVRRPWCVECGAQVVWAADLKSNFCDPCNEPR